MADFDGRCILVTGASGNLGSVVCARLLRGGANVFALVHREGARTPLASALLGDVGPSAREHLDVRTVELDSEASVEEAFDAAIARFGGLWAAVHSAGGYAGGALQETTLETFDKMIGLNLRSAFLVSRAALRRLALRKEGRIVCVAAVSAANLTGLAGSGAYAASKAGIIALVKTLAEEGAPLGVRASCVAPGTLRTSTNARAMPGSDASRWVPPEEVAEAIAFLCAPAAGSVNGAVVTLPSR